MGRLLAMLVGCDYKDAAGRELPVLHGAENDAKQLAALLAQKAEDDQPLTLGRLALLSWLILRTTLNLL